jgi:hypothetical protein
MFGRECLGMLYVIHNTLCENACFGQESRSLRNAFENFTGMLAARVQLLAGRRYSSITSNNLSDNGQLLIHKEDTPGLTNPADKYNMLWLTGNTRLTDSKQPTKVANAAESTWTDQRLSQTESAT